MHTKPEPSTGMNHIRFFKDGETGLLSIKQAAEFLNISSRTIMRHINSREIAFVRVFGQYRFKIEDMEKFIADNRTPSVSEQMEKVRSDIASQNF